MDWSVGPVLHAALGAEEAAAVGVVVDVVSHMFIPFRWFNANRRLLRWRSQSSLNINVSAVPTGVILCGRVPGTGLVSMFAAIQGIF